MVNRTVRLTARSLPCAASTTPSRSSPAPRDRRRAAPTSPHDQGRAGRRMMGHRAGPREGGAMSAQAEQIKSSLDRSCDAWKTNDGAAVAGFFVEDGSLINPFG